MLRFTMHVVLFGKSGETFEVGDVKDFEKFAQDNQSWLELFADIWLSRSILKILLGLNGQMQMLVLVKLQHSES